MAETSSENPENKPGKKKMEDNGNTNAIKEMKLSELKVADLRTELEARGMDKTGVKAALVERLKKALEDEGEDPEDYLFEMPVDSSPKKTPVKRVKETQNESKNDSEDLEIEEEDIEELEDKPASEDLFIDNSENGEILQLSLDDKEVNLDGKDEQRMSDIEEEDAKTESVRSSGKGIKNTEAIDTKDLETDEAETKASDAAQETDSEGKSCDKAPAKDQPKEDASKTKSTPTEKNVWVTGLASTTRAADLKTLFSKQGKVASVKIVTNARQVSGEKKYYGFIRMSLSKDAHKAVQKLHNTELNGQIISLEVTEDQPGTLLKRTLIKATPKKSKPEATKATSSSQKTKKESDSKDSKPSATEETHEREARDDRFSRRDRERDHRSRDMREYRDYNPRMSFRRPFGYRGRMRGRGYSTFRERAPMESYRRPYGRSPFFSRRGFRPPLKPGYVPYPKMRDERLSRDRFREREMRESERRHAQEAFHHKMVERKQREEAYRLEREKVQLRIEREILERERAEILKIEREKQRVERERLEREKEKLRRQTQMRDLGLPSKRPYPSRGPGEEGGGWEKEKRVRYESRHPSFTPKPPMESRPEFRDPPSGGYNRHKFEPRPGGSQYDHRDDPQPSRSDFNKYAKDKPPAAPMRDHDERRVYKRSYFKEEGGRNYPPRDAPERYPHPQEDRGFKRKVHENVRAPRGRGRRMSYY